MFTYLCRTFSRFPDVQSAVQRLQWELSLDNPDLEPSSLSADDHCLQTPAATASVLETGIN